MQQRLISTEVKYSLGPYNKHNDQEQWIRITEGCPNQCPYCYEPREFKIFGIPELTRPVVKIMDMNLLAKPDALCILQALADKRIYGKQPHYELICGIDYRFLTQDLANAMYKAKIGRFNKKNSWKYGMRLAWDWHFDQQSRIRKAIRILEKAGYKRENIMVFMIANWEITYEECLRKLNMLKYWGVQVDDCYWDNQLSPNIIPLKWTAQEIKNFRHICRKHNQIVAWGIDIEPNKDQIDKLEVNKNESGGCDAIPRESEERVV